MERILELFRNNMFFIATMDGDQPRVRPFGRLFGHEGKLYINTGNTKEVYWQMKENPKVELCVFSKGKIVRLDALANESSDEKVRRALLESEPGVAHMYEGKEDTLAVFRLEQVAATVTERGEITERIVLED